MRQCLFLAILALSGCFQMFNEDDELHAVPVTNNPHIIPNHGSGLPMGGGAAKGPY